MEKSKRNKKSLLIPIGFILILSVFFLVLLMRLWGGTSQPLAFNHKIHAEIDLSCQDCHLHFMDRASSGRPEIETCASCHEEALTESEEERKLVESIRNGEDIDWVRLYRVPEDVYFSHRRHVALAEIECSVCHGDIGESTRPPSKPRKISMKMCMKCHEERQADNDCIACHR